MVLCSCGKPIEKIPNWLASAKVDFVCNNCPNRSTKNIAFVTLEAEPKLVKADDDDIEISLEDIEEPGDDA